MKKIIKKSVVELPNKTGQVSDTINVTDKVTNAPSINLVQQMVGVPTDGIIYYEGDVVPEGYEEVESIGANIYSTEEIVVGTWYDGKPIYRKVINGFFDTDIGYVVIDMSTSSDITNCYGMCQWNEFIIPLNFYWSDALKTLIQQSINDKKIYLAFGTELKDKAYSLVVEYIKTTD